MNFIVNFVWITTAIALTHEVLGTGKPWLWEIVSHASVAGLAIVVTKWKQGNTKL